MADDFASLASFLERHRKEIHWLIRGSQGLWTREDVESEAFIALLELRTPSGNRIDPAIEGDASLLLQYLRRAARHEASIQPWHRFKVPVRQPAPPGNQQELDFRSRPPQPAPGQMWLV